MKLEEAEGYAVHVTNAISILCVKTLVVGSIRRRRPEVNDVDMIAIALDDAAWRAIPGVLFKKLKASIVLRGNELIRVVLPDSQENALELPFAQPVHAVRVDIYRARAHTWGVLELIRTGSKEHNVKLCAHAMINHMMLSASKGVVKDGFIVASRTEEEIFKALGLEFVPPEQREA